MHRRTEDFVFAERGTLINLAQIMGICKNEIQLSNGVKIQASHNREDIDILCDEVYEMEEGVLTKISLPILKPHNGQADLL